MFATVTPTDSASSAAHDRDHKAAISGRTGPEAASESIVAELASELTEAERDQLYDSKEIARYVRATNGVKEDALKRLKDTFEWRRLERPQTVSCTYCEADPRSHYMHVVGHDSERRPVIYSCLAPISDRNTAHSRTHMIATFEQAIRLMPKGVEQWVWVADFAGFGVSDVDTSLARVFLNVSAEYYPERLGHFIVLDAPSVFNILYKMVKPWIDPVTTAKITFVGTAESAALFKQLSFPEPLIDWLQEEIRENRKKSVVRSKVYSYAALEQLANCAGNEIVETKAPGHSPYGPPQFMERLRANPAVLRPAATSAATEQGTMFIPCPGGLC